MRDGKTMRRCWYEFCVLMLCERVGRYSSSSSNVVQVSPVELKTSSSSGRSRVFSSRSSAMSGITGRLGGRLFGAMVREWHGTSLYQTQSSLCFVAQGNALDDE